MNIKECFKKRILIKIAPDIEKSESSVKTAEMKLAEAKELFSSEFFNQVVITAYTSMFHIARALLYKDGIQEKGHFAVFTYFQKLKLHTLVCSSFEKPKNKGLYKPTTLVVGGLCFFDLNEKYSDKIPKSLINSFFNFQNERHAVLYGLGFEATKQDAEDIVIDAEDFLFKIKIILNIKKTMGHRKGCGLKQALVFRMLRDHSTLKCGVLSGP